MRCSGGTLSRNSSTATTCWAMRSAKSMGRLSIMLVALFAGSALAETRSLAVLEFRNKLSPQDRAAVDGGYLSGQVRTAAVEAAPSLRVITKENLIVLLQSTGKDLESCEGECE